MMRFLLHIVLFWASIFALKGVESCAKEPYTPRIEVLSEECRREQLQDVLAQAVAVPAGSLESTVGGSTFSVRVQVKPTSSRHHTWGIASVWQENRIAIQNDGGPVCLQTATAVDAHCKPCWLCRWII